MSRYSLLGIAGALRQGSYNRKLMREAARLFDPAEFTEADIALPLYDGDVEANEGIPPEVQRLADQIAAADAVVISTPEYNGALSGVLKNALDWVSRTKENPWLDKPVAIMSAAAGRAGGTKSQASLRLCLTPFRPWLLTGPGVAVAGAADQFDENGRLAESYRCTLSELMDGLRRAASYRTGA